MKIPDLGSPESRKIIEQLVREGVCSPVVYRIVDEYIAGTALADIATDVAKTEEQVVELIATVVYLVACG